MRRWPLHCVLLLAGAAACQPGSGPTDEHIAHYRLGAIDFELRVSHALQPADWDPSREEVYVRKLSPATDADSSAGELLILEVYGRGLELRDGLLRLGKAELGPVRAGDVIEIRPEGVFVSGERRGAFTG